MEGLRIESPAEWQDIVLNEAFSVSFEILEGCILHIVGRGDLDKQDVEAVFRIRNRIVKERFGERPFAEIRSYSKLKGMPSWAQRYQQIRKWQESPGNFRILAVCDAPMSIQLMYRMGSILYRRTETNVQSYKTLAEAVPAIRKLLHEQKPLPPILCEPEWNWTAPDQSAQIHCQIIPGKAWISRHSGDFRTEHVHAVINATHAAFESSYLDNAQIWRIADYSKVTGSSLRLRSAFLSIIRDSLREHHTEIIQHVICGASWSVRASILFTQHFFKKKYLFLDSFEEAMQALQNHLENEIPHTEIPKRIKDVKRPPTHQEIDELIQLSGSLVWESERPIAPPQNSPFASVYEALEVLRCDLHEERERRKELDHMRISYEKQLEEALQQARQASEAKGNFLATMSHEIRTPMNGIIGASEILMHSQLDAEQKVLVDMMRNSGNSLLVIINDILDFSKIESGQMQLENTRFHLWDLCDDVIALLGIKAQEKQILLLSEIPVDLPQFAMGDSNRLRQILINLLGNAIKFTQNGWVKLVITCKPVANVHDIHFSIMDTGIGMDSSVVEHLFQPFQQADTSIARRFGGTGLGLAISQRLVQAMGGEIKVTSQVGQGSTFHFSIATKCEPFENPQLLHGKRVVIYDEQEERKKSIETFLQGMGAQIQIWGESCDLSILTDHPPMSRNLSPINIIVGDSFIAEAPDLPLPLPLRWNLLREKIRQAIGLVPQENNALPCENCQKLNMSILVVDDNAVNRKVASLMLQKLGCTYTLASGGFEALELLPGHSFDACLMDCQMPGLDGFETTKQARELEKQGKIPHIPIIALTAGVTQAEREHCLSAGMDGFLPKPLVLQSLRDTLHRWK